MEGCLDCGHFKKHDFPTVLQICSRCYHRRVERKKTFQEILDTETNYGRDLNILKEVGLHIFTMIPIARTEQFDRSLPVSFV